MNPDLLLVGLPGEALVREGLADIDAARVTVPACLVAMAAPRLRRAGLLAVLPERFPAEAERAIYRLLRRDGGDAYSRYNALLRELVSFELALDHRLSKAVRDARG